MSIFKKSILAGTLAVTAVAGLSAPAMAQERYRDRDDTAGIAIGAGVLGLAIGAIAASDNDRRDRRYYDDRRYYNDRYYRDGYYYDRGDRRAVRNNGWDRRRGNERWDRRDRGRAGYDRYYSRRGF